jgi:predicted nucleic acid-binding protein
MTFVLDSSVGFKWLVVEQETAKARKLRDEYLQGVHDLRAPDVYAVEIAHALTRAERQRRITTVEGAQLMTDMFSTLPQMFPSLPLLPRAYQISSTARIGVYDCLYVALAEQEGCQFVTTDSRLLANLQAQFPFIVSLSTLP